MFLTGEKLFAFTHFVTSQHVFCVAVDILFASVAGPEQSELIAFAQPLVLFVFVDTFSRAVCKPSMPNDVTWRLASHVFPSSVKYNQLDSPVFLFMERYTSAHIRSGCKQEDQRC